MNRRASYIYAWAACALSATSCGSATSDNAATSVSSSPASLTQLAEAFLSQGARAAHGSAASDAPPAPPAAQRGSVASTETYPVGTTSFTLAVGETRRVPAQLWYPAVESARAAAEAGRDVVELEPAGPVREQWARLNAQATPYYTQRRTFSADAPESAAEPAQLPVVVISHCNECLRLSYLVIAEQLAAHGFLVAAPDHSDGTLYDAINGTSVGLDMNDFLEQRRLDMLALTDVLLDPAAESIPAHLRARADPARIGMLGHSFGAITTAYASTRDPRIHSIGLLTMAVSLDNRLPYTGEELAAEVMLQPLSKPALFVMAEEDRGALFGLNDILLGNFRNYPERAWLASIADTGHYSVSNLCGIVDVYADGCGPGQRLANLLESFTYLNLDYATDLTAQLVRSFFEQQLNGAAGTSFEQIAARASSVLTISEHVP
jgi:dienelactone hydrolase